MKVRSQEKTLSHRDKRRITIIGLTLAFVVMSALNVSRPAQAQTFTVLHTFTGGTDGEHPRGRLVGGSPTSPGTLYGTTEAGGVYGFGVVFNIDVSGRATILYSFTGGEDGAYPQGGVIHDSQGNLYGTTYQSGDFSCHAPDGCGTVFKLDTAGAFTVLYSFTGRNGDGEFPFARLILDTSGNLYGTTEYGGDFDCNPAGCGTVFKIDAIGNETVLHAFAGNPEGVEPYARLLLDTAGNVYGTTGFGGAFDAGTVFKLDVSGELSVLYAFTLGEDGGIPTGGVVQDKVGNLYGTTELGGAWGNGTIFKLGTAGNETVLHAFAGPDGAGPSSFELIRDSESSLYGVTYNGGANSAGTIFKLDRTGKYTVLYDLMGGQDGQNPSAGLTQDAAGNLYGSTLYGGDFTCDCGIIFKLNP